MLEIKFFGRGGQGVVKASQILGLSFYKAGMYPQCYSLFGGERRGAPLVSFLRVDKDKILLKCEIENADELLYLDDSLINPEDIYNLLRPAGRILINTHQSPDVFDSLKRFDLGFIDAQAIAKESGLGKTINTAFLGAYCRFTGHIPLDDILWAIEESFSEKKEANREAAQKGYANFSPY
ncbi:MAG: 2-oxoacid:acceptor oxidoreductase family protein [Desulfobacterales bacterium]|nr:MAG: 2-oxoacid:acceptor oxidoreductase family protein [Desulfobacterales bacterium]